ncbi:MAG: hypothetical protein MJ232_05860 [archaeon]|nr:hypothetical protein [archaeon]
MKKSYIIVLLVLMVIASAAFLLVYNAKHSEDITNGTSSLLVSQHGVSIIVPQEWVKADTNSNSSILAVANSSSKDSDGFNDINVNIERKQSVNSLDYEFKNYCKSLASDYNSKILFTGNVSNVGKHDGMEVDYKSNLNGVQKQHKSIWIKKDDFIYVILCSAPAKSFSKQELLFNAIIGSFKFRK